ncbi:MAG: hypothetical protein K8S24_03255 [Candidatus Aegiribacteria sp.]|nr:hypothetical protein [Candidatus Aegiribacteria sp.]
MSLFAVMLLLLSSVTLEFESDGTAFFETTDSLWIAPGSITAIAHGDTLNAVPGTSGVRTGVIFDPPPPAGSTVILEFEVLQLSIPSSISLDVGFVERRMIEQLRGYTTDPFQEHGLYISGSKRIGFSVGDGGGLDQGTRISVEGTAAPGITVSGSITDRNLTAGPTSSELISQLDRIFFIVEGSSWRARLGDMEWISGNGETGPLSWRREVSGVDAQGDITQSFTTGAGYGTSGDSRQRNVFYTDEGIQGPYDVSSGWEIVPGSEKVWLDGQLMSRGATEDYQMEYTAGLLTFTARRLIRNDSRVEITFFQRGDGFRKDFITAFALYSQNGLEIEFKGFQSEDNRESPLGFLLTEEAVAVLSELGEDPADAWLDGASSVGEGQGSYTLDSLGHYVYAGPNQGDWNVIFGRPPSGNGDYIYDSSRGGYIWAGSGVGTHLPRQYIQIPKGYSTGGFSAGYASGSIGMELEAAFSCRTGNLYNPDETSREGTCFIGAVELEFWEDGPGLGMGGRLVSSGYEPPAELEPDSALYAWSLPAEYDGRDNIVHVSLGGDVLLASTSGRFMESGGILERYRISSNPVLGNISVTAGGQFLRRNDTPQMAPGQTSSISVSAIPVTGSLKPFAGCSFSKESWEDSLSGRVNTGYTGISFSRNTTDALLRIEFQDDERSGGASGGPFNVWRARLEGSGPAGELRYNGSFEHSSTSYDSGGELHADAIRLSMTGTAGDIWMQAVYNGSGTVSRSLDVIYVYAGEGEGNYSYDPESSQYYADPDGDYTVIYQPGAAGDVVTSASLEATLSASGASSGISSVIMVSASNSLDRKKSLLLYGAFDSSEEGGYSLDISPWFRWETGLLSRLGFTGRLRNERISYSGAGLKDERFWSVRAAPELSPADILVIECSAKLWREEEELYYPRDTRGLRLEIDPTLEPSPGLKPGIMTAYESRREVVSGLDKYMIEAGPHFSWIGGGWNATARVSAGYIPGEDVLPAWFFDGNDSGTSWRTSARIGRSLSSGLDISVFYWGRKPSGGSWSQRAGLEGTVNF